MKTGKNVRKENRVKRKQLLLTLMVVALSAALLLAGCKKTEPAPQVTTAAPTGLPTEPVTTDPVETEPVTTEPMETEPMETVPATTEEPTTAPTQPAQQTQPTQPTVQTYTVTFQDYDGTVLKTQTVQRGKAAEPPADPTREEYIFNGWDKAYDNVTSDLVVTATYRTAKTVIYVEGATISKGDGQVTVRVRIMNNPGIMGATLRVSVDDSVFGFASAQNSQFPGLALTAPGPGTTASPYTFLLDAVSLTESDRKDGTLFSITFTVKDPEAMGNFTVALSYNGGEIFDELYNNVQAVVSGGTITIQ